MTLGEVDRDNLQICFAHGFIFFLFGSVLVVSSPFLLGDCTEVLK